MKMDDIVKILKDCRHGMPKFLCRRCTPRSKEWTPPYKKEKPVERIKLKRTERIKLNRPHRIKLKRAENKHD